ncbi:MAG: SpoIIE family protein phosphatase [Bacteroidetes bacterium]|nr:SpoIIE family protein phosphatase [Bacteroidota bacterium]MCL5268377.1 SpoIIE family protein phosphatase [Bacteroidota bacterium]
MSIRNSLYFISAGTIAILLLIYDWIRITIDLEDPILNGLRNILTVVAFVLLFAAISSMRSRKQSRPLEILRRLVAYGFFAAALISTWGVFLENKEGTSGGFAPQNVMELLATTAYAFGIAAFVVLLLMHVGDIIYIKPEKKVRRRFQLFLAFAIAAAVLSIFRGIPFLSTLVDIAFGVSIIVAVFHIVSMNWIVFLTRKEKYKSLVHSFVLMALFGYSYASIGPAELAGGVLQFYSVPMDEFAKIVFLFLTIYFSLAFVVTVFHIPTSGVFEKKKRELDSYQNLSKVITNVMDTTEVLNNTVAVVGTVTQASKVWIELRNANGGENESGKFKVSATHKTSQYELSPFSFDRLRGTVQVKKNVIVQTVDEFAGFDLKNFPAKSLLAVPLTAHDDFIGVLYAAHEMPYAFDEEEISTVSAFADTAAVAIQNSLLFTKSLENERLQHELRIAHEMQLKLLPTSFPCTEKFETDFLSFPAFEVGGDYIDYSVIDDNRYAFVVGDVSGKGTSAAFYMAFMKGVFQSLSASAKSPSEFMMAANEAVDSTLQKNYFITMIHAILDVRTGEVDLVRAGHTPGVLIGNNGCRLLRPAGAGLGLEPSKDFGRHLEEERIILEHGDTLVFYTDGVTDQRDPGGDEFGEERFYNLLSELSSGTAEEMKGGIIRALAEFSQGTDAVDDTTVLILKWR